MIINKTWFIILILLGIVGGILLIYPHLADNIWQDEAYTLIKFSTSGPFYPFTNYHVPNNHPLFSSLMSLWWGWGDSIVHLRLLPFLIFIFVLALFAYTAKRLGGPVAAIFATILFATSQVTENFALQIRGYSLSWLPVTACLLALPHYIEHGHKKWIILFIISSAVCIAIIPSNMFICLAFVLWGFSLIFLNKKLYIRQKLLQVLLILLGPLLGMVSYSLIWHEVIKESQKKWSQWNYSEIIQHWSWATISDFILLIPFILLGAILLFKAASTEKSLSIGSPRNHLLLISSLMVSFLFWMIISPNPPFPRTFVPFLPVWYFCIAVFCAATIELFRLKFPQATKMVFGPLIVILFCVSVFYRQPCTTIKQTDKITIDLCSQYFHAEDYKPFETVLLLKKISEIAKIPIVTDFESNFALGFLIKNYDLRDITLKNYTTWDDIDKENFQYPPVIVTRDQNGVVIILKKLGLPEKRYQEIASTGFFKIYNIQNFDD